MFASRLTEVWAATDQACACALLSAAYQYSGRCGGRSAFHEGVCHSECGEIFIV